jgi:hypothetical protein
MSHDVTKRLICRYIIISFVVSRSRYVSSNVHERDTIIKQLKISNWFFYLKCLMIRCNFGIYWKEVEFIGYASTTPLLLLFLKKEPLARTTPVAGNDGVPKYQCAVVRLASFN